MKPLPAQASTDPKAERGAMPSLPTALAPTPPASYSAANRRASTGGPQKFYPWLVCTSTVVAAGFCLLYITKPVIHAAPHPSSLTGLPEKSELVTAIPGHVSNGLMPSADRLPGEAGASQAQGRPLSSNPRDALSKAQPTAAFEETNLRIQHILTAEAPGGNLARIDIEVPVLYQSRNLRWTAAEVAEARALLLRLADYQEKSQALRIEGAELLDSWNRLVESSIPGGDLRADSPTLPINQQDAAASPRPAALSTTESIQIQPAEQ